MARVSTGSRRVIANRYCWQDCANGDVNGRSDGLTERDRGNIDEWRGMLLGTNLWHRWHRRGRGLFGALPSPPRCMICAAPFKGPFTPVLRFFGRSPHPRNPRYCGLCMNVLLSGRGGAEVELTSLFADV